MKRTSDRLGLTFLFFAFGFVLLALVYSTLTDGRALMRVVGSLDLAWVLAALCCAAASYLGIALSFSALLRITHHRVGFLRLMSITLVSTTFNFVVSTAGLSSLAVRLFLFKKEKVPMSVMAPVSVAQSMLTNVVLACFCLSGLLYLRTLRGFQEGAAQLLIWAALALLVTLVALTMVVFYHPVVRRKVFTAFIHLWHGVQKRYAKARIPRVDVEEKLGNVERSIQLLHGGWGPLGFGLLFVIMDWVFTAFTLGACFRAAGVTLEAGPLLVGFALAFLSTTINLLPGGLGVMEGLLTLTYAQFGIPPEKAFVSALLFRVVYFLVPLALSSFLYLDTLKRLLHGDYREG